ncbi:MAG TPA: ergosterol biosynthesis protein [Polyangia bacterium]
MPGPALVVIVYAVIIGLHLGVPGRWRSGYVRDAAGEPLRYRLNGLRVLVVVVGLYGGGGALGLWPWDLFYTARWGMAAGACALGLAFSLAIVAGAAPRRGWLADFYLGRRADPRWGGGHVDAKMALYLVGAVMLELNVLSFAAHHVLTHRADPSPGVLLHAALFSFFVVEYLNFEHVHLYTYDLVAERVGFKLGWGCLCFYPFFYPVGLWFAAARPNPHTPAPLLAGYAILFFAGWALARGANMQKYLFKTRPGARFLGLLAPGTVAGGGQQVLCSGFWGLSRHINYLGEVLMATALTLSLGQPAAIWPWLYPLYYIGLLLPRQYFDDQRCAEKYGALWAEYRRRVPYRIIPWVY